MTISRNPRYSKSYFLLNFILHHSLVVVSETKQKNVTPLKMSLSKGKTSKSMYTVTFTSSAPFLPVCSTYSGEYMNKKLFIWLRYRWRYCRHMFPKINRPRLTFILLRLAHPCFVYIMEVFGASFHIVFSFFGVDYLILQ